MSLRIRLFIIISLVFLLILSFSIFLLLKNKKTTGTATNQPSTSEPAKPGAKAIDSSNINTALPSNGTSATPIPTGMPVKPLSNEESIKNGVQQLAKIFIERFQSYSTDSHFQNIVEVQSLVTPELWARIQPKNPAASSDSFTGVTTRVITVAISTWADDKADIALTTTREENKKGKIQTTQGSVVVGMVKQGNNWLVDHYTWSK